MPAKPSQIVERLNCCACGKEVTTSTSVNTYGGRRCMTCFSKPIQPIPAVPAQAPPAGPPRTRW